MPCGVPAGSCADASRGGMGNACERGLVAVCALGGVCVCNCAVARNPVIAKPPVAWPLSMNFRNRSSPPL